MIRWRSIPLKHRNGEPRVDATGHPLVHSGAIESDCGQYFLARAPYAGEVWYTAFFGKNENAMFLQRSLDRADCEKACEDHKAHATRHHHENNDGV